MITGEEHLRKLKQLDRIEYRQRRSCANNKFYFEFVFVMLLSLFGGLAVSLHGYFNYEFSFITNVIIAFSSIIILLIIIDSFIDKILSQINLDDEYFKIEANKK